MLTGIPIHFDDGATIFSEGDAAADLYLIRSGSVRLVRDSGNGHAEEVAVLSDGDFFGEMAVFDPGPRLATAIAHGSVDLEAVDRPTFLAAMDDDDVQQMLAEMARRISGTGPERG